MGHAYAKKWFLNFFGLKQLPRSEFQFRTFVSNAQQKPTKCKTNRYNKTPTLPHRKKANYNNKKYERLCTVQTKVKGKSK